MNNQPPPTNRPPIRTDLAEAIELAAQRLVQPGTWWTGQQRRAIAEEARHARTCPFCLKRKESLSISAVKGAHDALADFPPDAIDAIHRLSTDSGRLSENWVRTITAGELSEEAYVEIIGVVAIITALDTFDYVAGNEKRQLAEPQTGEPTRHKPAGAKRNLAWIKTLAPEDVEPDDPNPYPVHGVANIHRGLSLVPQEVFNFFDLDVELYIKDSQLRDFGNNPRAIKRSQIELIAGRASAINNCHY
ncbi:MAG: hypothetical protein KTR32_00400 [Granulosicoccus sp.]|nr:hypothetical protein [Granulosicoccus sp.]